MRCESITQMELAYTSIISRPNIKALNTNSAAKSHLEWTRLECCFTRLQTLSAAPIMRDLERAASADTVTHRRASCATGTLLCLPRALKDGERVRVVSEQRLMNEVTAADVSRPVGGLADRLSGEM